MRRAGEEDLCRIRRFLQAHEDDAMFALANLDHDGLAVDGQPNPPRSLYAWIDGDDPQAFVAITEEGMLLPVLPEAPARHWAAIAPALARRRAFGITGSAPAARAGIAALGLAEARTAIDRDEPQFALDLTGLQIPAAERLALWRPGEGERSLMESWRAAYHIEVLGTAAEQAATVAARDIAQALERDTYRLLLRDGAPVSMAGINAAAGDIVQVGGVYTPPELRRRGLARRAVALMLEERRQMGTRRAVLFAASDEAAKAYIAIGFTRIGDYTLTLFDPPAEIAP